LNIDVKLKTNKREVAASRFIFFGILKYYYPLLATNQNKRGWHAKKDISTTEVMTFLGKSNHSSILHYKKAFENNMMYPDFKSDYYRVLNVCEPTTKHGIQSKEQTIKELEDLLESEKKSLHNLVKEYYKYETMEKEEILKQGDKKIYIVKEFTDYMIVSNTPDHLKKYKLDKIKKDE